jgi:hypothetical protein
MNSKIIVLVACSMALGTAALAGNRIDQTDITLVDIQKKEVTQLEPQALSSLHHLVHYFLVMPCFFLYFYKEQWGSCQGSNLGLSLRNERLYPLSYRTLATKNQ